MSEEATTRDHLAGVATVAFEARQRSRASWFPLSLFGLVILAALPFFRVSQAQPTPPDGIEVYWLITLPAAFLATAIYLRRRAVRVGVASPIGSFTATCILLLLLLVIAGAVPAAVLPADLTMRGLTPLLTVGVGMIVQAIAERSRGLAAIATGFLLAALVANLYNLENVLVRLGVNVPVSYSLWPNVALPGLILLIAGLVLGGRQRVS